MKEVELPQGTIRYRESGSGEPIVFMHGLLVNGLLWRKVVPLLEADFRCIVPDLPLGSHPEPMNPDADLSPPGLAAIVDRFIGALELDRVTLVANDTGGAIAQITAANHPERIGRLVLTNCDAFENFLPPPSAPSNGPPGCPGVLTLALQGMRFDLASQALADGLRLADQARSEGSAARGVECGPSSPPARSVATPSRCSAASTLATRSRRRSGSRSSDRPTLIAWAEEDRFFKLSFAERLADAIPGARLERIPDSYTFVSEDQPERLAELISAFSREPNSAPVQIRPAGVAQSLHRATVCAVGSTGDGVEQRENRPITVVLADDHAVVRSALSLMLEGEPGIEVVAEAGDADAAARYVGGHRPAVLILDLNMPGGSGLAAIPRIREQSPDTQIVVLTMQDETAFAREALQAGVLGYILKEAASEELVKAVRMAAAGRTYLQPELGARLAAEPEVASPDDLSDRELEVLRLIALGHTNNEIAEQLYLSVRTVESHRAHIQQKLGLSARSELVRYAIERGLIEV